MTTTPSATTSTESHYTQVQSTYEKAFFYTPGAYMDHLQGLVVQDFQLPAKTQTNDDVKRHLLDIGGGTGNFTQRLLDASPSLEAVVVDPFLTMSSNTTPDDNQRLHFVAAAAEVFAASDDDDDNSSWWRRDYYDHILLKEVVHHLENRVAIFQGMHQGFRQTPTQQRPEEDESAPPPQLLIITRPQTDIDYPLWPAARDVWAAHQPSADELTAELYQAGFSRVTNRLESYPCQIALSTWQTMVQQRFWSTFSKFSDQALQQACAEMPVLLAEKLDDQGVLHFEDRLVFLTACK